MNFTIFHQFLIFVDSLFLSHHILKILTLSTIFDFFTITFKIFRSSNFTRLQFYEFFNFPNFEKFFDFQNYSKMFRPFQYTFSTFSEYITICQRLHDFQNTRIIKQFSKIFYPFFFIYFVISPFFFNIFQ